MFSFNKITIGAIVVLFLSSSFLYVNNLSLKRKLDKSDMVITSLQENVRVLNLENTSLKKMKDSENEIVKALSVKQKALQDSLDSTIKKIEDIAKEQEVTDGKGSDAHINSSIARVLRDLCNDIRGNPCPHP